MDQKHYNMMDWEAIESIVYADSSKPFDILSVSKKGKSKLIQAFYPDALKVTANFIVEGNAKSLKLEKVDDAAVKIAAGANKIVRKAAPRFLHIQDRI